MGRVPAKLITSRLERSFSPICLSSIGAQAGGNIGFDVSSSRERLFVRTACSNDDIESDPCGSSQLNFYNIVTWFFYNVLLEAFQFLSKKLF